MSVVAYTGPIQNKYYLVKAYYGAGAPVDGTTGANDAEPTLLYIDTTNFQMYINAGTNVSPVWKQFTRAA